MTAKTKPRGDCKECSRGTLTYHCGYRVEPHGERSWEEWYECTGCASRFDADDVITKGTNMPHDARNRELKVGDTVVMPFTVKGVHSTEEFCNLDLESCFPMPGRNERTRLSEVNTRQVVRQNRTDDTNWRENADFDD